MSNEELIEALTRLSIDSNERIGRANEIVAHLAQVTASMNQRTEDDAQRMTRMFEIFDKHLTELESNRDLVIKECQQLRDHCDKLTDMMQRCQHMQETLIGTIESLSRRAYNGGTSISIGHDNELK